MTSSPMSNINKQELREAAESIKTYYIHPMAFGSTQDHGHGHVPVVKADDFEKLRSELEAAEKTSEARREALDRTHKMYQREKERAEATENRVAELEESHSKLRESMAAIHNTIRLDGAQTSLAVILNAAKRAHEESAAAAGIRIEGED